MLIGSIVFVLLAIWLIYYADNLTGFRYMRYRNPTFIRGIGIAGVLFFGLCAIYLGRKIPDNKPGIIIDKMGLIDNSSGVAAGQILWSDIEKISVIEIHRQKLILLHVKNPQDYIGKQTSAFKRKMMQLNFNMYETPLSITSNSLQIKFDELLNILNQYLSTSRKSLK